MSADAKHDHECYECNHTFAGFVVKCPKCKSLDVHPMVIVEPIGRHRREASDLERMHRHTRNGRV